jgi:hypothetical protein
MTMREDDLLYFNGVNGATGEYGLRPRTGEELTQQLLGESSGDNALELKGRHETKKDWGVKSDVDVKDLRQTGWGVVFTSDTDPAVREALQPLLDLRLEQAGDLFKIYEGDLGYRPGDSKEKFLRRCGGGGSGPIDPRRVPYYLLLVGDPESIPYRFQNLLGVPYAVGRIAFDTPEDYANYAASVVTAEKGEAKREREMAFFGVDNDDDKATSMSAEHLVRPLLEQISRKHTDWQTPAWLAQDATKANLARVLGGDRSPALLFSASHGMEFPSGDARQIPHQGALLCQDWPGPKAWRERLPEDFYFAGDDLASDASLLGLIHFSFACYSGGTPQLDEYAKQAFKEHRDTLAPRSFLAGLPTRMLSHPKGGALAVVAHVDRAWSYSCMAPGLDSQTEVFASTFDQLLNGFPVGAAMEFFTDRYAEISTVLNAQLEALDFPNIEVDPWDVADNWTANNDARGYLILGDPAVRLAVAKPDERVATPPRIRLVHSSTPRAPETPDETSGDPAGGSKAGKDFLNVVVSTYNSEDDSTPPAIRSRVSLNAESEIFVSAGAANDEGLRTLHERMSEQAMTARLAFLEMLGLGDDPPD